MGAEHRPEDDKAQDEGHKPAQATERFPPTNKDDSVDPTGEGRSFGSDVESPEPEDRGGADPDPSLNPAGLSGQADRPDEGR